MGFQTKNIMLFDICMKEEEYLALTLFLPLYPFLPFM